MTFHPHLNRNSNRLFKRDKKILRDDGKSLHTKIPLLHNSHRSHPPFKSYIEPKPQYSSVPIYRPQPHKNLPPRNEQNQEFDYWCIIL